jgi:hypothetical protein
MADNSYFIVGGAPQVLTDAFNKEIVDFTKMRDAGLIKVE